MRFRYHQPIPNFYKTENPHHPKTTISADFLNEFNELAIEYQFEGLSYSKLTDEFKKEWDIDTVILYDESTSLELLNDTVENYAKKGSVCVQRCIPEKFSYKTLVKISNGEVNVLENDA